MPFKLKFVKEGKGGGIRSVDSAPNGIFGVVIDAEGEDGPEVYGLVSASWEPGRDPIRGRDEAAYEFVDQCERVELDEALAACDSVTEIGLIYSAAVETARPRIDLCFGNTNFEYAAQVCELMAELRDRCLEEHGRREVGG